MAWGAVGGDKCSLLADVPVVVRSYEKLRMSQSISISVLTKIKEKQPLKLSIKQTELLTKQTEYQSMSQESAAAATTTDEVALLGSFDDGDEPNATYTTPSLGQNPYGLTTISYLCCIGILIAALYFLLWRLYSKQYKLNKSEGGEEGTIVVAKGDHVSTTVTDMNEDDAMVTVEDNEYEVNNNNDDTSGSSSPILTESSSLTNGKYFSYMMAVVLAFVCVSTIIDSITYLRGHGWSGNPMEYELGLREDHALEEIESFYNVKMIGAHVAMALSATTVLIFQILSTFFFTNNSSNDNRSNAMTMKELIFRRAHRIQGRFLAFLWALTCIAGAAYTMTTERWDYLDSLAAKWYILSISWINGTGSMTNLVIGMVAVIGGSSNKKKGKTYLLHKSAMSFGMFWMLKSGFNEVIIAIVQVSTDGCPLGVLGILLCQFCGNVVQLTATAITLWQFDKPLLLSSSNIRCNLIGLAVLCCHLLLGIVVLSLNLKEENACLNPAY